MDATPLVWEGTDASRTESKPLQPMNSTRTLTAVLLAWLLAGTLDITTAIVYYTGASANGAERLLQGIASGVLGAAAFTGGAATAVLGVLLHYLIALIWTLVLFAAFREVTALRRHLVLTGIAYGVVVWLAMNLIVLPLSNVHRAPFRLGPAIVAAVILVFCIGLPISLVVGRPLRDSRDGSRSSAD
jgi:hypothetical protein